MDDSGKSDNKKLDLANNATQGLRVPLPAALVGLGMLASASQAQAGIAVNDHYFVQKNHILNGVNVLANDILTSNSSVFVFQLTSTSHGASVVDAGGNLTYSPNIGFVGVDSFTYVLSDNSSNSVAQVDIQVGSNAIPALGVPALVGLAGLLAFFGLRRRRD